MDVLEAIKSRTSVRRFKSDPVAEDMIVQLIDMGRRAPSGRNVQPIEFVVVSEGKDRARLAQICEYGKFIAEAPVCILVYSADTKYYLEDGCAAVENILIAATGLGLGSCWVAGDKKPYTAEIDAVAGAPAGYKLITLIAIGYAAQPPQPREKRPLEEVLHWGHF